MTSFVKAVYKVNAALYPTSSEICFTYKHYFM